MERVLTPEEKLKRAEEIYQRRKSNDRYIQRTVSTRVNVGQNKDFGLLKKMLIQILICMLIYISFYIIKNNEIIFSEEILQKTNEILSYDINFQSIYQGILNSMNYTTVNKAENQQVNEILTENTNANVIVDSSPISENIEPKIEETLSVTEAANYNEEVSSFNQMELDAKQIKENYNLIKPLTGTITSRFGIRNPTTESVPKYHTGIDIARADGSVIIAAMDGKVSLVSSYGDYGNHIKIMNDDVMTLYAHCQTIYVKEGDEVKRGQEIAEVGRTGNVTGSHLHFEIRKSDRYVDPDLILDF